MMLCHKCDFACCWTAHRGLMTEAAITIDDLRHVARARLPRMLFDFVDGGAGDEATLRANYARFADYSLVGQVLRGVGKPSLEVDLFGRRLSSPILISPTGSSGLLWPRGEAEVAKACADAGTIMIVSAGSTLSIEEIGGASSAAKWLQIFLYKDRAVTEDFVQRASSAGYEALCLTVDCPLLGRRERDIRNGFTINPRISLANLADAALHVGWWMRMAGSPRITFRNFDRHGGSNIVEMAGYISSLIDPGVSWWDVEWLRSIWKGPLVIKGIMRADDAKRVIDVGGDAILVSNHGGRQLDHSLATIDALPDVVDAVNGAVPVLLDGGIRRGTDVLKAVALGATAVSVGRAHLWGLAANGSAGVRRALSLLQDELEHAMVIGGWSNLREIDRSSIRVVNRYAKLSD